MTRKGFLGLVLGAPCLGWVKKLDKTGKDAMEVIEPIHTSGLAHSDSVTITNSTITTSTNSDEFTIWINNTDTSWSDNVARYGPFR